MEGDDDEDEAGWSSSPGETDGEIGLMKRRIRIDW